MNWITLRETLLLTISILFSGAVVTNFLPLHAGNDVTSPARIGALQRFFNDDFNGFLMVDQVRLFVVYILFRT